MNYLQSFPHCWYRSFDKIGSLFVFLFNAGMGIEDWRVKGNEAECHFFCNVYVRDGDVVGNTRRFLYIAEK